MAILKNGILMKLKNTSYSTDSRANPPRTGRQIKLICCIVLANSRIYDEKLYHVAAETTKISKEIEY